MLSIAKLSVGQERYYERSVAHGLDDYYAGHGEAPGIWVGAGAEHLGLSGVVLHDELPRIVDAVHPKTRERLRQHAKARTITVERFDLETGTTLLVPQELKPVAGFDLVFSAPKSVSLIHALGDEEARKAVADAHDDAWRAAIDYLEREAAVVRTGKAGAVREHATGLVAAAYTHRTSRAQDPQLHTHVIVANVAQGPDGRWRALDGTPILQTYRLAAGHLYQAHLRHHLSRSLSVRWTPIRNGLAEIDGFAPALLEAFSSRRADVLERLAATGEEGWHAAQRAAHETRDRKEAIDLPRLREIWRSRASAHGLTPDVLDRLARGGPVRERPLDVDALERLLTGPLGLTAKRTTFTSPQVVMALNEHSPNGLDAATVLALRDRILAAEPVERLTRDAVPGRPDTWSTRDLLAAEDLALRLALEPVVAGRAASPEAVRDALARETLGDDQALMVRTCGASRRRVELVVGAAGAGKTTATRALATALSTSGIPVLGAAPTGTAARQLEQETGIRSSTLHRLLADARAEGGLPPRSVVVVDEAAMVESRLLAPLLDLAARADARLVLVGDHHQLPSVGAGGIFMELLAHQDATHLTTVRRQRDPLERAALATIRDGRGRDYLAWASENGHLHVEDTAIAARTRLLSDWWAHARADPTRNVMIAHRRRDVADLNRVARQLMRNDGRLGEAITTSKGREFAIGDAVICRRNDAATTVTNGLRGAITGVSPTGVRVRTVGGAEVDLPRRYVDAGHLAHAYAITGHASQGATLERAFVLLPASGRQQEWSYVALSRSAGRTSTYVAVGGSGDVRLIKSLEREARDIAARGRRSDQRQLHLQESRARPVPDARSRAGGRGPM